jgi:hypothetical protein
MAKAQPAPPEPDVEDTAPVEPPTVDELLGTDDPYELVRAKDATTGAEYTTTRVAALNAGSAVLTKPARDQFGQIVPTKTVLDLRAETNPTDADADAPGNTNPQE